MIPVAQLLSQLPLLSSLLNPQTPLSQSDHNNPLVSKHSSCPNPPSLSCASSPSESLNTCCINHPSGHFLQTQFWDTSPPIGPNNSWTIHGLWPDLCRGGFDTFCDDNRSHSDIRGVLHRALQDDESSGPVKELLSFMESYWLSYDGNDENLWSHEWNKHGTCISTLDPDCYAGTPPPSSSHRHHHIDVLDYFIHTTSLFRTLDTYTLLANVDILPSHTKRYSLRDLEDAISSSHHGQPVTFRCNRRGELDEVWYHFSVMGSLRHSKYPHPLDLDSSTSTTLTTFDEQGQPSPFLNTTSVRKHFIPAPPDGILSNCPRKGIKYLPKTPADNHPSPPHPRPTTTKPPTPPRPTSTSPPFTGKGHLEIHILLPSSPSSSLPHGTSRRKERLPHPPRRMVHLRLLRDVPLAARHHRPGPSTALLLVVVVFPMLDQPGYRQVRMHGGRFCAGDFFE